MKLLNSEFLLMNKPFSLSFEGAIKLCVNCEKIQLNCLTLKLPEVINIQYLPVLFIYYPANM